MIWLLLATNFRLWFCWFWRRNFGSRRHDFQWQPSSVRSSASASQPAFHYQPQHDFRYSAAPPPFAVDWPIFVRETESFIIYGVLIIFRRLLQFHFYDDGFQRPLILSNWFRLHFDRRPALPPTRHAIFSLASSFSTAICPFSFSRNYARFDKHGIVVALQMQLPDAVEVLGIFAAAVSHFFSEWRMNFRSLLRRVWRWTHLLCCILLTLIARFSKFDAIYISLFQDFQIGWWGVPMGTQSKYADFFSFLIMPWHYWHTALHFATFYSIRRRTKESENTVTTYAQPQQIPFYYILLFSSNIRLYRNDFVSFRIDIVILQFYLFS